MSRTFSVVVMLCALLAVTAAPAGAIEDYPRYQPATKCSPKAKPGTTALGHWLVRTYGGGFGPISRACGGTVSEHTEGRAFDWTLDAAKKKDRRRAKAFLDRAFATDAHGHTDALARRMGIMYVIWNDRMYSAWNGYEAEPYLNPSCPSKKKCSKTLRHRNHLHISQTRRAAQARTSWYR